MSGGSYEYFYYKIEEFAGEVRDRRDPRRIAFIELLGKVAEAAQAIEWVDSGDWGSEQEAAYLDAVLHPQDVLEAATKEALGSLEHLRAAIRAAEEMRNVK